MLRRGANLSRKYRLQQVKHLRGVFEFTDEKGRKWRDASDRGLFHPPLWNSDNAEDAPPHRHVAFAVDALDDVVRAAAVRDGGADVLLDFLRDAAEPTPDPDRALVNAWTRVRCILHLRTLPDSPRAREMFTTMAATDADPLVRALSAITLLQNHQDVTALRQWIASEQARECADALEAAALDLSRCRVAGPERINQDPRAGIITVRRTDLEVNVTQDLIDLAAARSSTNEVRVAAIEALGPRANDPAAVRYLSNVAQGGADREDRVAAIRGLGQIRDDPEVEGVLVGALSRPDTDEAERIVVASSLCNFQSERAALALAGPVLTPSAPLELRRRCLFYLSGGLRAFVPPDTARLLAGLASSSDPDMQTRLRSFHVEK